MVAIVQQVTGAPAAATGFTTSAITTSSSNTLILIVGRTGGAGTGALATVTDTAGNTWQVATRGGVSGTGNTRCEVWYTNQNIASLTAGTVTVTSTSSQASIYNVVEVSGLNSTVDVASPDHSGAVAATTHSTPAVTTTNAADWILSVINHPHNAAADTFTSSGGTQLTSVVNGTSFRTSAGYYTTSTIGSNDGDWTLPASLAAGLITVAFRQAAVVVPGPFTVLVDWNRDGDYGDTGEDVTDLVMRSQAPVSVGYGRDQSTALAPTVSGHGSFTLNNQDKRFSPRNTASPLFGKIKPARPVKIIRTLTDTQDVYSDEYSDFFGGAGGTTETVLFIGHTDDSPINPDVDSKTVTLSLVDSLADFRGQTISTALYAGKRTGEAIDIILDQCGWTGGRDLDDGATVMPWWWEDNTDALDALEKLVRCEGPPALLTIGVDGGIIFKDRHHRLVDAPSITSQDTWYNVTGFGEPVMSAPFIYDEAWRNIINTGLISVDVRTPSAREAVWTLDSPLGFTASETKTFIAATSDPFLNAVVPANNTDYTIISGSISSITLSRTSGASTTITVTAGGGGAQISGLQLRAQPVQVAYTVQVTASDAVSIADYGQRSFPGDLPFCNQYDAQAVLDTAVQLRSEPLPVLSVRFVIGGSNTTRAAATLSRDLSDRVTIVESETVLNDDFYVESIAHEIISEFDHSIIFGAEAVPPDGIVTAANVFLIGGGVGHQIGDGVLAS